MRETIQGIPAFQVDGKFDPQRYQLALASQVPARTPRQFEDDVRKALQAGLIPTEVSESAFATPHELDRLLKLLGEKRDVSYAILPPPAPDTAPITATEIQRWYDSHPTDYRAPETVTLEYVDIDGKTLPAPAQADEATLRQRYDQEKNRFVEPEQRLASHILVKVDANASPAAQKAAQDKAAKLAEQAQQPGADFAALARANSDDTGSKAAGGDLGWVAKGVMVKPFEDALFTMQAGQVSGPVKIRVRLARDPAARGQGRPAGAVRGSARATGARAGRCRSRPRLQRHHRQARRPGQQESDLARAGRAPGQPAGAALRAVRARAGHGRRSPIRRCSASRSPSRWSRTVPSAIRSTLATGHSVLIRVAEHTQAHQLPLTQVSQRVVAAIRGDRAAKAAGAARTGSSQPSIAAVRLKDVAGAQQLPVIDMAAIPRGTPMPDAAVAEAMFRTPSPAAGKASAGKAALADGRVVVFAVTKVIPGNPAEATAEQKLGLQQQLAQMAGGVDVDGLVSALRKRIRVTVAEDRL